MKRCSPIPLIFGLMLSLSFALSAQQRFTGAIIAGVTASQIDGDLSAGYNKLGLMAGGRAGILLGERTETSIELLYVQRGAQNELVQNNPFNFSLTLHYIEVPFQFHYKDWLAQDANNNEFYRVSFNAGVSYARLMNTTVRDDLNAIEVIAPDYLKENDFSFMLGASFFANSHLGFNFRWVRSFIPIYEPADWNPAPAVEAWWPHSLYFSTMYVF
ncbi:MAG: porin family protein [Saprospiraceae bacterium]